MPTRPYSLAQRLSDTASSWRATPSTTRSFAGALALALLVLLVMTWGAWQLARQPYDGVEWSYLLVVRSVAVNGPAVGLIQTGDRIVSIDGKPPLEWWAWQQRGPLRSYVVERGGATQTIAVPLRPPTTSTLIKRLSPLAIAVPFWLLAVAVAAVAPPGTTRRLAFWTFLLSSLMLTSGAATGLLPVWDWLFIVSMWWGSAVLFLFHLHFPLPRGSHHYQRLAIGLLGVAAAASLLELANLLPQAPMLRRLWLALSLLGTVAALITTYRRTASLTARGRIGLVAAGGSAALVPMLTLALLPDALLGAPLLDYELTFLFLLLIPATYGYAIFRYRFIPRDRYLRRAATAALVAALLGVVYLLLAVGVSALLPALAPRPGTVGVLLGLALGLTALPLYHATRRLVDPLLYGGWYDYRSAIQQFSGGLAQGDTTALATSLCRNAEMTLQREWACLLLADVTGVLRVADRLDTQPLAAIAIAPSDPVVVALRRQARPLRAADLRRELVRSELGSNELCGKGRAHLWVPLLVGERLVGVLLLGERRGDGDGDAPLDPTDRAILEAVMRYASIALDNQQLIIALRQRVADNERLQRELRRGREAERKRIARELHDEALQELVALTFQLAALRAGPAEAALAELGNVQAAVQQTAVALRRLCSDLRPPELDRLGLAAALHTWFDGLAPTVPFQIQFHIEGDATQPLPEDVSLCLYRVVQEALRNVQKHARATRLTVRLTLSPQEVWLTVADDGVGFVLPVPAERLIAAQHFGLLGMRERLHQVAGTLDVLSLPKQGTTLRIWVPLEQTQLAA